MTRAEFLGELRETLSGNMSESEVQSNLAYYSSYIDDEVRKGKTEEEVLEELGSPFAIAKTLLRPYENEGKTYEEETKEIRREGQPVDDSTKKIITIVIVVAIGIIILSMLFGLLAFVIRYAVPISAIVLVVYFLKKR